MNAYRKNSYKAGTFTSNGFIETGKRVEYETVKTHSFAALLVFLVPAVLLVAYIMSNM